LVAVQQGSLIGGFSGPRILSPAISDAKTQEERHQADEGADEGQKHLSEQNKRRK